MAELTQGQRRAMALANARLRLKQKRHEAAGDALLTLPDRRIEGAFADAAEVPPVSITPEHRKYGFTDAVVSSLPFADEVVAGGAAGARYLAGQLGLAPEVEFGDEFNKVRALERAALEEYQTENPTASAAATGVGLATVGAPRALLQAGSGAAALPVGLKAQIGQGVTQGALVGGAYGAGEGEGAVDRLKSGATGAVWGAGTGAAVPIAIAGGSGVLKRFLGPVAGSAANAVAPEGRAIRILETAFSRDNIDLSQAAQKMASYQKTAPDMVLADIGGANVRSMARAAVNTPGAARENINAFLQARNLAQPNRITNAVSNILRNPDDFGKTSARMAAQRVNIASPIYEKSFTSAKPVNLSQVLFNIDKQVKPGVNQVASPLADLRPDGVTATLGKIRDFFATTANQRVDLRALHGVKMELDDLISSAMRSGDTVKARAVLGVKKDLVRAMERASPLYGKARGIYSSTHEMDDALEIGRSVFSRNADDLKTELANMTPAEKEMVQIGAARAIRDQIDKVRDGRDVVKAIFSTPKVRDALRSAFQDEQAFRKFRATMVRETAMRRTSDAVKGNSTTAAQIGDMLEQQSGAVGRDVFNLLLEGRPLRAGATAVRQMLFGEVGVTEKVANRMADMLLSNDPQKIGGALLALQNRQGAVDRLAQRLAAVQQLTTRELAGGAAKALAQ